MSDTPAIGPCSCGCHPCDDLPPGIVQTDGGPRCRGCLPNGIVSPSFGPPPTDDEIRAMAAGKETTMSEQKCEVCGVGLPTMHGNAAFSADAHCGDCCRQAGALAGGHWVAEIGGGKWSATIYPRGGGEPIVVEGDMPTYGENSGPFLLTGVEDASEDRLEFYIPPAPDAVVEKSP